MQARDVMTENVVCVTPATPVDEVVRLMLRYHISAVPVIDAGRREVYAALYGFGEDGMRVLKEERGGPPGDFLEELPPGPLFLCGDGAREYRDLIARLRGPGDLVEPDPCFLGSTLARWAALRLREKSPWTLGDLKPNYIRPPDAEARPRT